MVLPALQVRVPTPANALLQAEQIKAGRAQNQALQQQQQGRNALLTALQGGLPTDAAGRAAVVDQVGAEAPLMALQLQQQFAGLNAQDQAQVAAEGQQVARGLIGVGNQLQYSQARAALGSLGQSLPEQYDPGFVQSTINQARTIEGLLKPAPTTALSPGQTLFNTQTGAPVASLPAEAATTDPQDVFKNANTLRDEFVKQTDDFAEAQTGFQRVQVGAAQDSGQGDVALIFGFMKTIDPASTVREGEFATAEDTGSAGQRFLGLYNRVVSGERLTPVQRQGFVDAARAQFDAQRQTYDQTVSEYTRLSTLFGLPPANVIVNRALEDRTQPQSAAVGASPVAGEDVSSMTMEQLDALDPKSLSDAELLAAQRRVQELSGAR